MTWKKIDSSVEFFFVDESENIFFLFWAALCINMQCIPLSDLSCVHSVDGTCSFVTLF